ncbi:MAG: recombination protein RecR [Flavobacteriales bacterium]|nr:recombination protein RecR [Flavobacteriales bacterium]
MNFSSKLVENAVNSLASLPGIGKRTALRLVLYLLKKDKINTYRIADSIKALIDNINYCNICYNICEENICSICNSEKRNKETICVIRDFRDLISIENTKEFNGLYHILGGLISPMEGINPSDLNIESLLDRVKQNNIKEVILALSTTMDGETTNFFIYKKLIDLNIKITTISRGVSIGDDLEYTDEITLGRSLINRQPFEYTLKS